MTNLNLEQTTISKQFSTGDLLTILYSQLSGAYDVADLIRQNASGDLKEDADAIFDKVSWAVALLNTIRP